MSSFSELVKNFSKTRDYVRDFFIYGFKIRSDFDRKSSRTYDNERRRVESWLGAYVQTDDSQRGRQVAVTVDSGHILENPLYQAYYAKSFTDNDIALHFLLLDLLADGERFTIRELLDHLSNDYAAVFDEQIVRHKLKEYLDEGLILVEKTGKSAYYRLSPVTFAALAQDYPGLADAVRFFSETQPFGVIGNSILRGEGLRNEHFLMKHNYIVRTLEDDMLIVILRAMEEQRFLDLRVFSARSALSGTAQGRRMHCVPLRISTSVQTGRRYLLAYSPDSRRFSALRLEFLRDIQPAAICTEYAAYEDMLVRNLPHVFGVSFGAGEEDRNAAPLRLTLRILPEEGFLLERIRREMRSGTFGQIADCTYRLTLDVFDPQEALPWIRTFTGRILKLEGGTKALRERFREDLLHTAALYAEQEVGHDAVS